MTIFRMAPRLFVPQPPPKCKTPGCPNWRWNDMGRAISAQCWECAKAEADAWARQAARDAHAQWVGELRAQRTHAWVRASTAYAMAETALLLGLTPEEAAPDGC